MSQSSDSPSARTRARARGGDAADAAPVAQAEAQPSVRQLAVALEELGKELRCSVCLSLFASPVILPCGHSMCRDCFRGWLATRRGPTTCMLCKQVVPRRSERADEITTELVRVFRQLCPALAVEDMGDDFTQAPCATQLVRGWGAQQSVDDESDTENRLSNDDPGPQTSQHTLTHTHTHANAAEQVTPAQATPHTSASSISDMTYTAPSSAPSRQPSLGATSPARRTVTHTHTHTHTHVDSPVDAPSVRATSREVEQIPAFGGAAEDSGALRIDDLAAARTGRRKSVRFVHEDEDADEGGAEDKGGHEGRSEGGDDGQRADAEQVAASDNATAESHQPHVNDLRPLPSSPLRAGGAAASALPSAARHTPSGKASSVVALTGSRSSQPKQTGEKAAASGACVICLTSASDAHDVMLQCDTCCVRVHSQCYGVDVIPAAAWRCSLCVAGVRQADAKCVLCPCAAESALSSAARKAAGLPSRHAVDEGDIAEENLPPPFYVPPGLKQQRREVLVTATAQAFHPTLSGEWVHAVCASWMPETFNRCAGELMVAMRSSSADAPAQAVAVSTSRVSSMDLTAIKLLGQMPTQLLLDWEASRMARMQQDVLSQPTVVANPTKDISDAMTVLGLDASRARPLPAHAWSAGAVKAAISWLAQFSSCALVALNVHHTHLSRRRPEMKCTVCGLGGPGAGAIIQCSEKACIKPYHPMCALQARLFMKIRNLPAAAHGVIDVEYVSYCAEHSPAARDRHRQRRHSAGTDAEAVSGAAAQTARVSAAPRSVRQQSEGWGLDADELTNSSEDDDGTTTLTDSGVRSTHTVGTPTPRSDRSGASSNSRKGRLSISSTGTLLLTAATPEAARPLSSGSPDADLPAAPSAGGSSHASKKRRRSSATDAGGHSGTSTQRKQARAGDEAAEAASAPAPAAAPSDLMPFATALIAPIDCSRSEVDRIRKAAKKMPRLLQIVEDVATAVTESSARRQRANRTLDVLLARGCGVVTHIIVSSCSLQVDLETLVQDSFVSGVSASSAGASARAACAAAASVSTHATQAADADEQASRTTEAALEAFLRASKRTAGENGEDAIDGASRRYVAKVSLARRRVHGYLCALLSGVWLVTPDWVEACEKAGGLVHELPYAVAGDRVCEQQAIMLCGSRPLAPLMSLMSSAQAHASVTSITAALMSVSAPARAQAAASSGIDKDLLFAGISIVRMGEFETPPKNLTQVELRELVVLGGGTYVDVNLRVHSAATQSVFEDAMVAAGLTGPDCAVKDVLRLVVVCDEPGESLPAYVAAACGEFPQAISVVNVEWLLDSVSCYAIMDPWHTKYRHPLRKL